MTETEFRIHYEQFRDPLFRFGYRLTGSPEVAEDLVHDCFVGLFRGGFDERRSSLKTYLYAAVRNLSRKHYRDSGRGEPAEDSDRDATDGPLNALISRETAVAVQHAVEELPLLQREVLVLFEYEELTLDEISKIVDADPGAVKSRLHRARERLRKLLAPAMTNSDAKGSLR
jgi:RNA polymerase sigma-70 factor (ECF subfamily)